MYVQLISSFAPLQNPTFDFGFLSPVALENEDQKSHDVSATKDDKTKPSLWISHTHTHSRTRARTHTIYIYIYIYKINKSSLL